jgi:lipopolysaccharide biosynthesis glycosyltransferase
MNKYCYVTYASNERDICAIIFNSYNIKINLKSQIDFLCICTENVPQKEIDSLINFEIKVKIINLKQTFKNLKMDNELIDFLIKKHYFGKFEIFDLSDYDKCIFMDSDVLNLKNLDSMFEIDIPDNTIYMVKKINDDLSSDKMLKLNYKIFVYENSYNSGFIYFKPSKTIYHKIMDYISNIPKDDFILNIFGDECIFNNMFHKKILSIIPLSITFNIYPIYIDNFVKNNIIKVEDIVNIHFILRPKPWEMICNNNLLEINKMVKTKGSMHWYNLWINMYFKFKLHYLDSFANSISINNNDENSVKIFNAVLDPEYLEDFKKKQIEAKMFYNNDQI